MEPNTNLAFCKFLVHFFCKHRKADFLLFKGNLVANVKLYK
jgi:hypothetical protein